MVIKEDGVLESPGRACFTELGSASLVDQHAAFRADGREDPTSAINDDAARWAPRGPSRARPRGEGQIRGLGR